MGEEERFLRTLGCRSRWTGRGPAGEPAVDDPYAVCSAAAESAQSFAEGGDVPLGEQVAFLEDDAVRWHVLDNASRLHDFPSSWQAKSRKEDPCRHDRGWCATASEVDVELVIPFPT